MKSNSKTERKEIMKENIKIFNEAFDEITTEEALKCPYCSKESDNFVTDDWKENTPYAELMRKNSVVCSECGETYEFYEINSSMVVIS